MKYFKNSEFKCPCGCGRNEMDGSFFDRIDRAREYANTSFVISSGFRCTAHNKAVGGSKTSSHLKGLAVDIIVKNSNQRYKILFGLIEAGFNRVGIGSTFIHADTDYLKSSEVIWLY